MREINQTWLSLSFSHLLIEFKIKLSFLQVSLWHLLRQGENGANDFHSPISYILLFSISRLERIEKVQFKLPKIMNASTNESKIQRYGGVLWEILSTSEAL